ncbi:MAG: hypothetical protein EA353_06345 [Puniceicoccaceae bacterium]|nr:MAG: hypothetical protein EA353_06345 [Puniceicoccaceae bacterium]
MKSSVGSDWVTVLGHPVPKVKYYTFLAILVFIFIAGSVGGFLFVENLRLQAKEEKEASSTAQDRDTDRMNRREGVASDPLGTLLRYHIEATRFDKMTSLVVSGKYASEGAVLDLRIMAREPNRFLQTLQYENLRLSVGMVNGELWYDQNSPLLAEDDADLTRVNRVLMAMECAIPILSWQFKNGDFRRTLRRLPDETQDGREVAILENHAFTDMVILHQIDLETGLEIARSSLVSVGSFDQLIEIRFAAPAEDLEFAFPSGYTVQIEHTHMYSAEFEKYDFNKGIASYLFDKR